MNQLYFTKEQIIEACNSSASMAEAAKKLNIHYRTLKKVALRYDCFKPNPSGKGMEKNSNNIKINIQDIFNGNFPSYGAHKLKKRMISEGIKPHQCEKCKLTEWLGLPIPIELHHKDGNPHNHSLDNLEILCNNCHAFTDNFRGKAKTVSLNNEDVFNMIPQSYTSSDCVRKLGKRPQKTNLLKVNEIKTKNNLEFLSVPKFDNLPKNKKRKFLNLICVDCGKEVSTSAKRCVDCYNKHRLSKKYNCVICGTELLKRTVNGMCVKCYNSNRETKIIWPSKEELEKMVWEMPTILIARKLHVSDTAITKHCLKLGIFKPPLGYWAKKQHGKL